MPELLRVIHEEDLRVPPAVEKALPDIALVAERAARALGGSGRLIYVGAGTSGRLGILDAAECPPTFGTDPSRVVALIAGGWEAVFRAKEGAEDDRDAGAAELAALGPRAEDLVVGIAASGVTPYVLGALSVARSAGAATALITAGNPTAPPADCVIRLETGPEVLAGSTRMKAGTATKLVLNMISTAAMVRIGKVYDNLMVDVKVGSQKLRERAIRLVSDLTGLGGEDSAAALDRAGGEVKTAVVAHELGMDPEEARYRIQASGGHLRAALGPVSR
jgi:N-acetylmuramic acid 6-phosphate etherase